jgi:hypothetical protein
MLTEASCASEYNSSIIFENNYLETATTPLGSTIVAYSFEIIAIISISNPLASTFYLVIRGNTFVNSPIANPFLSFSSIMEDVEV